MHAVIHQALAALLVHQHRLVADLDEQRLATHVFQAQRTGAREHRLHQPLLALESQIHIAGMLGALVDADRLPELALADAQVDPVKGRHLLAVGRLHHDGCQCSGGCSRVTGLGMGGTLLGRLADLGLGGLLRGVRAVGGGLHGRRRHQHAGGKDHGQGGKQRQAAGAGGTVLGEGGAQIHDRF